MMKFSWQDVKEWYRGLYSSQDSKYFIATATKLTLVPTISFGIVFYSLWIFMEMNFNFFVSNGFASGDLFKEAFYDQILGGILDYFPVFMSFIAAVFMTGLLVSWFVLRSFDQIEKYTYECFEDGEGDFEAFGIEKNKLINQVSRIFFKYLQICRAENKRPRFRLPKKLQNLSSPPLDRVFFFQYLFIVGTLSLVSSWLLFEFTIDLHAEIVNGGIEVLPSERNIVAFLKSQEDILSTIYGVAIFSNISLYLLISKNIIKNVDGVSFGFSRDMLRIINGEHATRLRPRFADPGKGLANIINDYLDEIFYEEDDQEQETTDEEALDQTYDALEQSQMQGDFEDEPIHPEFEEETAAFEPKLDPLPEETGITSADTNVLSFEDKASQNEPQLPNIPQAPNGHSDMSEQPPMDLPEEDLPPAFIEERQVVGGDKVFHITTPEGLKVENVDAEMLLKIVKETKK